MSLAFVHSKLYSLGLLLVLLEMLANALLAFPCVMASYNIMAVVVVTSPRIVGTLWCRRRYSVCADHNFDRLKGILSQHLAGASILHRVIALGKVMRLLGVRRLRIRVRVDFRMKTFLRGGDQSETRLARPSRCLDAFAPALRARRASFVHAVIFVLVPSARSCCSCRITAG